MGSSEDFQRIYELYKKKGVPNGISIVNFLNAQKFIFLIFKKERYRVLTVSFGHLHLN